MNKGSIVDEIERKRLLAKINEHTELAKANRDEYEDTQSKSCNSRSRRSTGRAGTTNRRTT